MQESAKVGIPSCFPNLVIVVRDRPTDGHPAPDVHLREDPSRHLPPDIVEVAVHSFRGSLGQALQHSHLLVVESLVESNLLQPSTLVVTSSVANDFTAFYL